MRTRICKNEDCSIEYVHEHSHYCSDRCRKISARRRYKSNKIIEPKKRLIYRRLTGWQLIDTSVKLNTIIDLVYNKKCLTLKEEY
jgi:hypothetical protein